MKRSIFILALSICTLNAGTIQICDSLDGWRLTYLNYLPGAMDPEPFVAQFEDNAWVDYLLWEDSDFRPNITVGTDWIVSNPQHYHECYLQRTFDMRAGDTLSGLLRIALWDSNGAGWLSIYRDGRQVQIPFSLDNPQINFGTEPPPSDGGAPDHMRFGEWEPWRFTAPLDGEYTLVLGAASGTFFESYAQLSGAALTVPDGGSTAALLALALMPTLMLMSPRRAIRLACSRDALETTGWASV